MVSPPQSTAKSIEPKKMTNLMIYENYHATSMYACFVLCDNLLTLKDLYA